jgi:predicted MFS family arabinose efflux permease
MFPAFRRRDFRLLWLGNLAPQLSKWMEGATLGWLTLQVTDQPFYLGLVAFTRGLPSIVFAMGFGVLIDRFDRRRILLINQVVGFSAGLGMTYALLRNRAGIGMVLLFAFIMGSVAGVQFLTQQAMLSDLSGKENAVNAVALHAIGNHGTRVVGPSLAGYLIEYLSFAAAFFVQAVAYLWSGMCFLRMRVPSGDEPHGQQADARHSLRAGWSYLRSTPEMAAVMGLAATFFLAGLPYTDLMPYFAREQLGADAAQYGQLLALAGVGAFAASLLLGLLPTIRHKGLVLVSTCAGYGVLMVFLAMASDFWTAAVGLDPD